MAEVSYKEKLLDPKWQKKRLDILSRDNFTCQYCGDTEKTLHVHHFYYNNKTRNPWDVDDHALITLCKDCHFLQEVDLPQQVMDILFTIQLGVFCQNTDIGKIPVYFAKSIIEDLVSFYSSKK